MMFDIPVIERHRQRVVCKSCNWRGYRLDPSRISCPHCCGPVVPVENSRTPGLCHNCAFWQRNRDFPNRYGTCTRSKMNFHPLSGQSTYELFGCNNHSRSKQNGDSELCKESA
jgi:hypothetical protein